MFRQRNAGHRPSIEKTRQELLELLVSFQRSGGPQAREASHDIEVVLETSLSVIIQAVAQKWARQMDSTRALQDHIWGR